MGIQQPQGTILTNARGDEYGEIYCRINVESICFSEDGISFGLDAFVSHAKRQDDPNRYSLPEFRKNIRITGEDYLEYCSEEALQAEGKTLLRQLYSYIKKSPDYSGWTDLI